MRKIYVYLKFNGQKMIVADLIINGEDVEFVGRSKGVFDDLEWNLRKFETLSDGTMHALYRVSNHKRGQYYEYYMDFKDAQWKESFIDTPTYNAAELFERNSDM